MEQARLTTSAGLEASVKQLVETLWGDSVGHLQAVLSRPAQFVQLGEIERAEAFLRQIKTSDKDTDKEAFDELVDEFYRFRSNIICKPNDCSIKFISYCTVYSYRCIPHAEASKEAERSSAGGRQWLARKQDLCALLRDVHLLSEATDWLPRAGVAAKYRALRADVRELQCDLQSSELAELSQILGDSPNVRVHRVYNIERFSERKTFAGAKLGNSRLLCHSSPPKNLLGIIARHVLYCSVITDYVILSVEYSVPLMMLSIIKYFIDDSNWYNSGLQQPNVVVDDFGGQRTDAGMLGAGIYFASSAK